MEYKNMVEAKFIERPNRFIAHCKVGGEVVIAHVKNTGRCKELLIPGATVYLEHAPSSTRKTDYSLISVRKGEYLINIDSQAPNQVAFEAIKAGIIFNDEITTIKREVKYKNSRFDLYIETFQGEKVFIEVKGVTLEKDGVAMFPDAPTKRGTKHINELIEATKEGYKACILFIVQLSPVNYFTPNEEMDKELAEALKKAEVAGVKVLAYDCHVSPEHLNVLKSVPVKLASKVYKNDSHQLQKVLGVQPGGQK